MAMSRHLIVVSVIVGLIAGPLVVAQPLKAAACSMPLKARCCKMLPAQPTDAVKPQAPHAALVDSQIPLLAEMPPLPAAQRAPAAPAREVPTRTVVLRI